MNEQIPEVVEEHRLCKKCEKKLPYNSYFCIYCGTDNSETSVQNEYEKANNESLRKYTILEAKKKTIPWYMLFIFLIIDVIAINFLLLTNHNDMFVKVNSANFKNYEKTYYLAEDAYLAVKDNKIRIIGSNRLDYLDAINDIQQFEFKDIQEVYDDSGNQMIYFQTSKNIIYSLNGKTLTKIETDQDYVDIYHYLNDLKSNCYNSTENSVLSSGSYYFDPENKEIILVGEGKYITNGNKVCIDYNKVTVVDNNELSLENPELIYQAPNGYEIVLKNDKELVIVTVGSIEKRYTELTINGNTIKIEDIEKIFYSPTKLTIIDKKDDIHIRELTKMSLNTEDSILNVSNIKILLENISEEGKTNLIILLVALLIDLILLYKMSENRTFSKCINMSGLLILEYVLYTLFLGGGFELNSSSDFLELVKLLILVYILIIIISTVIVQISELVIKLLKLVKFKNIFSFILVFTAIISIFLNVSNSGDYGLFFAIFLLGSYWSYFTETEDIDIDLFITPSSYVPIAVLSIANIILFFILINSFKICNYFVLLLLLAIMYSIYLAARPNLAKKELTGKSIKSLLVVIMSLAFGFILTLLTMNLFSKLVKDDGTIMKYVLTLGFEYILYLVVTFVFLIIVSSVLRILHKAIKMACKNTNSIIVYLIFSLISLVLFSLIIYFFPEIINLINIGVNKVFTTVIK